MLIYHIDVIEFVIDCQTWHFWLRNLYRIFVFIKSVDYAIVSFNLLWTIIVSCDLITESRHQKIVLIVTLELSKHIALRAVSQLVAGLLLACKSFLFFAFSSKLLIGFGLGFPLSLLL
jgi:hypothetical protein